ncbi:MAG: RHS repeat domain-containing protein, partial [Bacteroidales bacterium]
TDNLDYTLYVSPYMVLSKGGQYTKHIYIGSQRIVSKLGDVGSFGVDPRREEYAGSEVSGAEMPDYKSKYSALQDVIKAEYKLFEVPYLAVDNDDYVNGQGFCCDDAKRTKSTLPADNVDYEKLQYYYHPDHLGSASYITNLDGEVVQHIEYVPFGEVFLEERNNTWNTPYLFNGKELDEETGLYYYGARYYNPRISLWYGVDVLNEERYGLSPYQYCQNNPIMLTDPTGLLDDEWDYDIEKKKFSWVSDEGSGEFQYVNIMQGNDKIDQVKVSGDEVYAYKLREHVLITNTDKNFNDDTYNSQNGYEYTITEFKKREIYLKEKSPITVALLAAEREGKAIPLTYNQEEMLYGYTVMRLKMFASAIDLAWDIMPTSSPSSRRVSGLKNLTSFKNIAPSLSGHAGIKSISGKNSWNTFLRANRGVYSGKGWQKRAAADYFKSNYYTRK